MRRRKGGYTFLIVGMLISVCCTTVSVFAQARHDSLVIAVISDTHNGGLNYDNVTDHMGRTQGERTRDLVEMLDYWDFDVFVICGDFVENAANSTHLEMFKRDFYEPYLERYDQPLYLVKGNHEVESGDAYSWYGHNNGWYSHDHKGIHLSFYGWGSGNWTSPSFSMKNMTYIEKDLTSTNLSTVVFFHAPMITVNPDWIWCPNQNPLNVTEAEFIAQHDNVIGFVTGHNHGRGQGSITDFFDFSLDHEEFTYNPYAISTGHIREQSDMDVMELGIIRIEYDRVTVEGWDADRKRVLWRDVFEMSTTFARAFTFSPEAPTVHDTVHFYYTSRDPNGSIVSWFWDFGDGHTSTDKNPTHKYSDKGSYIVTLTTTDANDNNESISNITTIINLVPTANFTYSPSTQKVGTDIQFTDKSSDPEGKTLEYLWNFGDGVTSTQRNPQHRFTISGRRYVFLTVTDDDGLVDSIIKSIKIVDNVPPTANFSYFPENQKINHDVHFTDESIDIDGFIVERFWDFGDGTISPEGTTVHQYKEGGKYSVRLIVTDDNEDTNDIIRKVNIIQTHDLTLEVKDILGLAIPNTEIGVYKDGECYISGSTDEKGEFVIIEIPEGNYEIQAKILGVITSTPCSLTQSMTEQIKVFVSINTIGVIGGSIAIIALLAFYIKRRILLPNN